MFNQLYTVPDEPAFVAVDKEQVIGFLNYTNFGQDAVLIVALGVQPLYQGCGIGRALIQTAEDYAKSQSRDQLLVVTSNDDLPALAFYQRQGFQLFEVIPDVIAQKLGGLYNGIGNIPIRDELRLRKQLNKSK
jgi:ribosomal protein S18 acetylase RimI-like enzyme